MAAQTKIKLRRGKPDAMLPDEQVNKSLATLVKYSKLKSNKKMH